LLAVVVLVIIQVVELVVLGHLLSVSFLVETAVPKHLYSQT
jgi:hypothetical protein